MQESEFTGCANKVQGRPSAGGEKRGNHGLFQDLSKIFPDSYVDALRLFLYDELGKGA
jgi:hypothetical protein